MASAVSILEAGFREETGEPIGDWHPTRYTPTLTGTEEFVTDGDKLIRFADRHWSIPDAETLVLDDWQRWLLRHVLERYPEDWPVAHLRGQLRFRQVVISLGRQNGKSLIGALLVIYFLALHVRGPRIIGVASRDEQAQIVYDRVRFGIDNSPALKRELKTTETRGISRADGTGIYRTFPAKEEAAQGEPVSGVMYDELHLGLAALWDALVLGQRARRNALLVGITTAGDDSSLLLQRLYREGQSAIDGEDERFGFFVWEADSDELTPEGVIAANPAIASGRVPFDVTWSDAVKMYADQTRGPDGLTGRQRVIRYTLNRFIAGASNAWVSLTAWNAGAVEDIDHGEDAPIIFALERTPSWDAIAITATSRHGASYRTELVATVNDPDAGALQDACEQLGRRYGSRAVFAMPAKTLGTLATKLKEAGLEVWRLGETEVQAAAQNAHGLIVRSAVQHPGDALLRLQMALTRRRDMPEGWRLSQSLSLGDIDTVTAMTAGLYVATNRPDPGTQLF